MADQITNYQCPACTGPLRYDGSTGRLECDYCGSSFDVAEIEALYAQKEEKAKEAFAEAEEKEAKQTENSWDETDLSRQWGEDGSRMRAYNCPSCGAELICDENTAAASCPYCGNPTVVPGNFSGSLKPDYILPFRMNQQQAVQALKKFYKGKRLLPGSFTQENKINQIRGIYVPFWMFDGKADAWIQCEAQNTHFSTEGDYEVTTTEHFSVKREGSVEFQKIPVDASSKMPDEYMDAIEPFDYQDLRPFSTAYLPGFLADRYDVAAGECADRADQRASNTAVAAMEADVVGYDSCVTINQKVALHRGKVHYALLPVYLLHTKWKGQDYLFAMNGQTGNLIGRLPVSMAKWWAWFAGITVPLGLIAGTLLYFIM